MNKCYEQDVDAPRVGCGCRECYHARERALDPNLLMLGWDRFRSTVPLTNFQPSREIVYRGLIEYLSGRLDYAALHVTIIKALMELADQQSEKLISVLRLQGPLIMTGDYKP